MRTRAIETEQTRIVKELSALGHWAPPTRVRLAQGDGLLWYGTPLGHLLLVNDNGQPTTHAMLATSAKPTTGLFVPAAVGRPALVAAGEGAAAHAPAPALKPATRRGIVTITPTAPELPPDGAAFRARLAAAPLHGAALPMQMQSNPPKGPNSDEIVLSSNYDMSPVDRGFGWIVESVTGSSYLPSAISAAVLRAYFKALGVNVKVKAITGYADVELTPALPAGIENVISQPTGGGFYLLSFHLHKPASYGAGGASLIVPAKYVHYMQALVASACAANDMALTPRGSEILANSVHMAKVAKVVYAKKATSQHITMIVTPAAVGARVEVTGDTYPVNALIASRGAKWTKQGVYAAKGAYVLEPASVAAIDELADALAAKGWTVDISWGVGAKAAASSFQSPSRPGNAPVMAHVAGHALYLTGGTKPFKEKLKAMGFKWSGSDGSAPGGVPDYVWWRKLPPVHAPDEAQLQVNSISQALGISLLTSTGFPVQPQRQAAALASTASRVVRAPAPALAPVAAGVGEWQYTAIEGAALSALPPGSVIGVEFNSATPLYYQSGGVAPWRALHKSGALKMGASTAGLLELSEGYQLRLLRYGGELPIDSRDRAALSAEALAALSKYGRPAGSASMPAAAPAPPSPPPAPVAPPAPARAAPKSESMGALAEQAAAAGPARVAPPMARMAACPNGAPPPYIGQWPFLFTADGDIVRSDKPPVATWHGALALEHVASNIAKAHLGPKLGTTFGGKVQVAGVSYYVKWPGKARAASEVLAAALYRMMGVHAPDARTCIVDHPSAPADKWAVISPWLDGLVNTHGKYNRAQLRNLAAQFPIDAWLANQDAIGAGSEAPWGNTLFTPDSMPVRIESGGALQYTGLGTLKPPALWADSAVVHLQGMLDFAINKTTATAFALAKSSSAPLSGVAALLGLAEAPQLLPQMAAWAGVDAAVADTLALRAGSIIDAYVQMRGFSSVYAAKTALWGYYWTKTQRAAQADAPSAARTRATAAPEQTSVVASLLAAEMASKVADALQTQGWKATAKGNEISVAVWHDGAPHTESAYIAHEPATSFYVAFADSDLNVGIGYTVKAKPEVLAHDIATDLTSNGFTNAPPATAITPGISAAPPNETVAAMAAAVAAHVKNLGRGFKVVVNRATIEVYTSWPDGAAHLHTYEVAQSSGENAPGHYTLFNVDTKKAVGYSDMADSYGLASSLVLDVHTTDSKVKAAPPAARAVPAPQPPPAATGRKPSMAAPAPVSRFNPQPIYTADEVLSLPAVENAIIAVVAIEKEQPTIDMYLTTSSGFTHINHLGALGDTIVPATLAERLKSAAPIETFWLVRPGGPTPSYASLEEYAAMVASHTWPKPTGLDVAASPVARAQVLLQSWSTWRNVPGSDVAYVAIPGWGAYFLATIPDGFAAIHTKVGSASYRVLHLDGNHTNGGNNAPPTAPSKITKLTADEAKTAVVNHVGKHGGVFSSAASPTATFGSIRSPVEFQPPDGWKEIAFDYSAIKAHPLPKYTAPPATKTSAGIARAFLTDGDRVLLVQQKAVWGLPSFYALVNESIPDAAKRAVVENVGKLPSGTVYAGIRLTAPKVGKQLEQHIVVLVAPKEAANALTGGGKLPYAWASIDELQADSDTGAVIWAPKLQDIAAAPVKVIDSAGKAGTVVPLLALWANEREDWLKHAKAAVVSGKIEPGAAQIIEQGIATGIPFPAAWPPQPLEKKNPRYRMQERANGRVLHYARPQCSVTIEQPDRVPRRRAPTMPGDYAASAAAPWDGLALRVFRRNRAGDAERAALLDSVGLPLHMLRPGPYVKRNPNGIAEPIATFNLTREQVQAIDQVHDALVALLGTAPSPSMGTTAQKKIKAAIQNALYNQVKVSAADYENAAKYLRYLSAARWAGLWGEVLDPGQRCVYRAFGTNLHASSFGWSLRGRAQVRAMGSVSTDLQTAAAAWIAAQASGNGFIEQGGIWVKAPPGALAAPASQVGAGYDPPHSFHHVAYGKVMPVPAWGTQTWANVAGFAINYAEYTYKGSGYYSDGYDTADLTTAKMIGHWKAYIGGYGGWGATAIRTTADSDPGFIMLPTKTLEGTSHKGEGEVVHVNVTGKPMQCEVINVESTRLTDPQCLAYALARPAYPTGWTPIGTDLGLKSQKKNPGYLSLVGASAAHMLVFDSNYSRKAAQRWAREHGYSDDAVRAAATGVRIEQRGAHSFRQGSFQQRRLDQGVSVIEGSLR